MPQNIVSRTLAKFVQINAVINTAGAVSQLNLLDLIDDQWDFGMSVKFQGAQN